MLTTQSPRWLPHSRPPSQEHSRFDDLLDGRPTPAHHHGSRAGLTRMLRARALFPGLWREDGNLQCPSLVGRGCRREPRASTPSPRPCPWFPLLFPRKAKWKHSGFAGKSSFAIWPKNGSIPLRGLRGKGSLFPIVLLEISSFLHWC